MTTSSEARKTRTFAQQPEQSAEQHPGLNAPRNPWLHALASRYPDALFGLYSPEVDHMPGRIDPTAWDLETPDHEHGADLCDIDPLGYVS